MARNDGRLKLNKLEENLRYVWTQIENWLNHRFKMGMQVEVIEKKRMLKEFHQYSVSRMGGAGIPLVYIDEGYLRNAKKDELVDIAGREACRIYLMMQKRMMINEVDPDFRKLVESFELPWYDSLPQDGMDMYEYRCIKCKKLITVSPKKLPASKNITYNPNITTDCCGAMIKESDDKHHYTNLELRKIKHLLNKY